MLDSPLISLDRLTKVYGEPPRQVVVLRDVSFQFHGGITAILGPSGQGKTTLLNLIGGLDVPTAGEVRFLGEPVPFDDEGDLRAYRARRISWVFQDLNLIGHLPAEENVALPLLCRGVRRSQARAAAREHLDLLGLHNGYARRYPHELSGGERQRVAIARAFAARTAADGLHPEPGVILADEPTGSLDPENATLVMEAFAELSRATRTPVVLVTHNPALASHYADRVLRCSSQGLAEMEHARTDDL